MSGKHPSYDALSEAYRKVRDAGLGDDGSNDVSRLWRLTIEPHITNDLRLPIPEEPLAEFVELTSRRARREPMSHILGYRLFWEGVFEVNPEVLDPRPETETLVFEAIKEPFSRVLDLGTGSGAILISLMMDDILEEPRNVSGIGVDLSPGALDVARRNAERNGVQDRCEFVQSDWYSDVSGQFDLVVSNPPYIAAEEMDALQPELSYEPRLALTDEGDGLSCYRIIAAGAPDHLTPGGRLMVEIGPTQGAAVADMFRAAGLDAVDIRTDLDGRDRVVIGTMPRD